MKLTNRGRGIKNNSNRTGEGAARKEARRQGARDRFKIMPKMMWLKAGGGQGMRSVRDPKGYLDYVARKEAEAVALGLRAGSGLRDG